MRYSIRTAWSVVDERDVAIGTAGMTSQMALGVVSSIVASADRFHDRRAWRLAAAPGTTFAGHVTLLADADAYLTAARVVACTTTSHKQSTQWVTTFNP